MAELATPWPAPAKLNLFLHVLGRRADGYHRLQTVFQLLNWGDELDIEPVEGRAVSRLNDLPGIPCEGDLSVRAARALQQACGVQAGVRLTLHKRIPAGSGLGGASSDAATVLVALNALWDCGLSITELAAIGASLGADVPVFVQGHSAWAEGVGDELTPLSLGQRYYILCFPGVSVSTEDIFSAPDLNRSCVPMQPPVDGGAADFQDWRNDCEPVVFQRHPEIAQAAAALQEWGPVRMTGTGSTLFISGLEKTQAQRLTMRLKSRYNVRAVEGVDRSMLLDRLAAG